MYWHRRQRRLVHRLERRNEIPQLGPATAGWPCDNLDNGFIAPDAFASADIICHKSTTNGQAYATATAGRVTGWGELYLEVNECGICIVRDLGR